MIKIRRLQANSGEMSSSLDNFRSTLEKLLNFYQKMKDDYGTRLKRIEDGYLKEIEVLKKLGEINLKEVWKQFDNLVEIVEEGKQAGELEEIGGDADLENFGYKRAKSREGKLIELVKHGLEKDVERRNGKIEFWKGKDEYRDLRKEMIQMENEFKYKEDGYLQEIGNLKGKLKIYLDGDMGRTTKQRIQDEILTNLKQTSNIKEQMRRVKFASKQSKLGAKNYSIERQSYMNISEQPSAKNRKSDLYSTMLSPKTRSIISNRRTLRNHVAMHNLSKMAERSTQRRKSFNNVSSMAKFFDRSSTQRIDADEIAKNLLKC
jgi:hypothetical protein